MPVPRSAGAGNAGAARSSTGLTAVALLASPRPQARHAPMQTLPTQLLATLKLLALLPGVKPRVAKHRLYGGLLNAVLAQRPSFKLWPSEVLVADCDEVFIPDRKGIDRVSPKGAEVLLRLYREGALPVSAKPPSADVERVLAYIASGTALPHADPIQAPD